jgi:hypothetical protein
MLFYSTADREKISRLDAEVARNQQALAIVQKDEKALVAKLKPLYGVVSFPFYVEQRSNIKSAISQVQTIAYNNAWYSGLFNAHRAESFTDLILQFCLEWLMGYIIMFPFAAAYYTLWTLPWSLSEYYSGGALDIVIAAVAWVVCSIVMLLPLLALGFGLWFVFHKYGDQIRESLRRHAEQQQQRRAQQQQFRGNLGYRPY